MDIIFVDLSDSINDYVENGGKAVLKLDNDINEIYEIEENKEYNTTNQEDENNNYEELNYISIIEFNKNNKLIDLFEKLNLNNNKNTGDDTNSINEKKDD